MLTRSPAWTIKVSSGILPRTPSSHLNSTVATILLSAGVCQKSCLTSGSFSFKVRRTPNTAMNNLFVLVAHASGGMQSVQLCSRTTNVSVSVGFSTSAELQHARRWHARSIVGLRQLFNAPPQVCKLVPYGPIISYCSHCVPVDISRKPAVEPTEMRRPSGHRVFT